MSLWKATLAVLVIFILGTVFGVTLSYWFSPGVEAGGLAGGLGARQILTQRLNQRITRNLSLSPQQEQAIAAIIRDAGNQIAEIRNETRPRVQEVIANARKRMRAQLNAQQQEQFDRVLQRNRRMRNRGFFR